MSFSNTNCSSMQYLPAANINSNKLFYRRDETNFEDNDKIFIDSGFVKKIYLKNNRPVYHFNNQLSQKHVTSYIYSAFDKAKEESETTIRKNEKKYQTTEQRRDIINDIVLERNKKIKEKEMTEKKDLEETLTRVIQDSLKFTKQNSPMIAMIPNKIISAINHIKDKDKNNSSKNINNIIGNSLNLSIISNNSINQTKYESNAFLKALGLDLENLTPENIKINIDEAYNFIKKWKITRSDVNEIIRYKVVNEIMNVEERRSVQKLRRLNEKYDKYVENKRNKQFINGPITEKRFDDYDNNTSVKNVNNENLVDENIGMNQVNDNNQLEKAYSLNDIKSKNDLSSINAKSTKYTSIKKDSSSNMIDSNNLMSINYSQSNYLNNRSSTNNNIDSPNRKIRKTLKNDIISQDNSNMEKNQAFNFSKSKNKLKNVSYSPAKRKLDYKLKPKLEIPHKKKRKLVLNSYKNIDRIMKIIGNSVSLKSNENLCKHFSNIRYNKKIDDITNKLLNLNKLTVQDFEEVEVDI